MFIIFCLYLYGLNLVGWTTAKVWHIGIFNSSSAEDTHTAFVIFNMASVLSFSFAIFVSVLLLNNFIVDLETTEIPEKIVPLTMLYLLNPLRWFIRKGWCKVIKYFGGCCVHRSFEYILEISG